MKALIQRVMNAKVTVNGEVVSSIGQGACIFIGICNNDNVKDMEYMARKILSIKLFDDENDKKWKKSVVDSDFEILCVSQFTLYNTWKKIANTDTNSEDLKKSIKSCGSRNRLKGNKPDFHNAMPSEKSKEFYDNFIQLLKDIYKPEKIKDGVFGAYMQVALQNDGPVTLELESPAQIEKVKKNKSPISKNVEMENNADR